MNDDPRLKLAGIERARHAIHAAIQIPAAAAHAWARRADDFSHTTLRYDAALGALVGVPLGDAAVRLAVRFSDLSVLVLDDGAVVSSHPAATATLEALKSQVADALAARGLDGDLAWLEHDLPSHPLHEGSAFLQPVRSESDALEAWFQRADSALSRVASTQPAASPVRCWPHHFDTALLIALDEATGEEARSIGVGMSPGDVHLPAPYWYVSPWPAPEGALPPLENGRWHRDGFTAAVLDSRGPEVDTFLDEAVAASRRLLQPSGA